MYSNNKTSFDTSVYYTDGVILYNYYYYYHYYYYYCYCYYYYYIACWSFTETGVRTNFSQREATLTMAFLKMSRNVNNFLYFA